MHQGDYDLPLDVEAELRADGQNICGPLRLILEKYSELSDFGQKRAVIMLSQRIPMPPDFGVSTTRLNLFDGEASRLLRYIGR